MLDFSAEMSVRILFDVYFCMSTLTDSVKRPFCTGRGGHECLVHIHREHIIIKEDQGKICISIQVPFMHLHLSMFFFSYLLLCKVFFFIPISNIRKKK